MSEVSRSRVTITLGRTGQVVKRAGSSLDSSFPDEHPVIGRKRPVRERLGINVESSAQVPNKRLCRDGRAANPFYDSKLSKDDLRYKIMQKNILKRSQNGQQNGGDLRDILSRPAQSSTISVATKERVPEPKDTRPLYLEPVGRRPHFIETRDDRNLLPVTRNTSLHIPEFNVGHTSDTPDPRKWHILQAREGERGILDAKVVRHPMPEPRSSSAVIRMESGINSYSPWTLDRLRRRSPDESLATSRGLTTPKKDNILQKKFEVRGYDDARTRTHLSKDAFDNSRPMSSSNLTKIAPPVGQLKNLEPVASQLPLPASFNQKSSYVVDDQVTVDSFLRALGLEKFSIVFKAEEVDMYSLKRMSERDLKELGIPMGPRKKILLSLQPRTKPQI